MSDLRTPGIALVMVMAVSAARASEPDEPLTWPQFRGPGGLAVSAEAVVPLDFGPELHVLWKTQVPAGHSSPCVVGDRIFLTGSTEQTLQVLALDRRNGQPLWARTLQGEPEPEYGHIAPAPAMATPCSDGERVFVYFGAYGLIALDLDGHPLWEKRLPVPDYSFGMGGSPIVTDGRVILIRDGAPEMAILAFDAATGDEVWRIRRFGFIESHATPFLWKNNLREELVIPGTRQLWSYDPKTGMALWYVVDVTLFSCTSATGDADTLYFAGWSTPSGRGRQLLEASWGDLEISDAEVKDLGLLFDRLDANSDGRVSIEEVPPSRAKDAYHSLDMDKNGTWDKLEMKLAAYPGPGKNVAVAVRAGGEGDVSKSHVRWSWNRGTPYVASPLLYQGRLWLMKAGGQVTCLDAATGDRILDRERLPVSGEYYLSPVGVADHVLAASCDGTLFVLDAKADELKVVHQVDFEEDLYATPAVLDSKIYLRTRTTMWAFGE